MQLPIYQVDAFTNKTFGGNPAAVVPLETWLPDAQLLNIAAENNLSETAFFIPTDNGFHIRWFTPTMEVSLCGHATLATTWVIYNKLGYDKDRIEFESMSGPLIVERKADAFTLNFPKWDSQKSDSIDDIIEQAFGRAPLEIHKGTKWVCIYDDEEFIKNAKPDIALLKTIQSEGVVITAPSNDPSIDFVSRYFGPQVGIDEDPVTGSAHCIVTPIWSGKLNKQEFNARQVSTRGGDLHLQIDGDRLHITGSATLYMEGTIHV